MKTSKITCEICHTKTCRSGSEKRIFMAKFPLDENRCKKWVAATGNRDLIYVPIEKLHQLKYVCGKHFRLKDFKKKRTQLRKTAVPCKDISINPITEEMLKDFPLHITQDVTKHASLKDHDYCSPSIQEPTTSKAVEITNHSMKRKRSCTPEPTTSKDAEITNHSMKRKRSCTPEPSTSRQEGSLEKVTTNNDNIIISPKHQKPIPTSVTPRRRKVLNKLKRSRLQVKNLQKQINQIENISSPVLKSLIESTVTNQKRKPNGYRWTKLNKTVALAIYKKSPKAYRYLSKLHFCTRRFIVNQ